MRPAARFLIAAAGIAAVCLVTLWACITVGCWLALVTDGGPTLSQAIATAIAITGTWLVARSVRLLVAEVRRPDVGRQL